MARPASDAARFQARAAEWRLVDALRDRDEAAFVTLVGRHHAALVRLARLYVPARTANGLAQEIWCSLLADLDNVDRALSLRVTLFRILLDRARSRRPAEAEALPYAAHWTRPARLDDTPVLDPSYFRSSDPWIGHWAVPVLAWEERRDDQALTRELRRLAGVALTTLPPAQREVVTLRDVEGWAPDEVNSALGITPSTQRTLLHRGRAQIRAALDLHLQG